MATHPPAHPGLQRAQAAKQHLEAELQRLNGSNKALAVSEFRPHHSRSPVHHNGSVRQLSPDSGARGPAAYGGGRTAYNSGFKPQRSPFINSIKGRRQIQNKQLPDRSESLNVRGARVREERSPFGGSAQLGGSQESLQRQEAHADVAEKVVVQESQIKDRHQELLVIKR